MAKEGGHQEEEEEEEEECLVSRWALMLLYLRVIDSRQTEQKTSPFARTASSPNSSWWERRSEGTDTDALSRASRSDADGASSGKRLRCEDCVSEGGLDSREKVVGT